MQQLHSNNSKVFICLMLFSTCSIAQGLSKEEKIDRAKENISSLKSSEEELSELQIKISSLTSEKENQDCIAADRKEIITNYNKALVEIDSLYNKRDKLKKKDDSLTIDFDLYDKLEKFDKTDHAQLKKNKEIEIEDNRKLMIENQKHLKSLESRKEKLQKDSLTEKKIIDSIKIKIDKKLKENEGLIKSKEQSILNAIRKLDYNTWIKESNSIIEILSNEYYREKTEEKKKYNNSNAVALTLQSAADCLEKKYSQIEINNCTNKLKQNQKNIIFENNNQLKLEVMRLQDLLDNYCNINNMLFDGIENVIHADDNISPTLRQQIQQYPYLIRILNNYKKGENNPLDHQVNCND